MIQNRKYCAAYNVLTIIPDLLVGLFEQLTGLNFIHVILVPFFLIKLVFLFQGMHACIVGLILRYTPYLLLLSAEPFKCLELCNSFFSLVFLTFVLSFEQKMQKTWAKGIEFASYWGGFNYITCGTIFLCGICNFLGCYSEVIIFMVRSRCSCKSHISVTVCHAIFVYINVQMK